ncbi:uncharacterized protein [Mytilus edulis]|uniref:uncharacterized protein n=1 Tax=Mytilus edulis TaxID=6550 RepID=UPI0039EE319B
MDCNTRLPYFICETASSQLVTIYPNYPPSTTKSQNVHNISILTTSSPTTRKHSSHNPSHKTTLPSTTRKPKSHYPSHLTTLPSTTRIHHSPNYQPSHPTTVPSTTRKHNYQNATYPIPIPFTKNKQNYLDAIIGGIIGGIGLILIVLLSLFICKTRKLLIFRKTFDADREILQPSENLSDNSRQCDINNYNNQTTIDKYSNSTNEIDVIPLHERLGRYENESNGFLKDNKSRLQNSFNPAQAQVRVPKQHIP